MDKDYEVFLESPKDQDSPAGDEPATVRERSAITRRRDERQNDQED